MVLATEKNSELSQQRERLYREVDKGIRDMEQGHVIPHEEAMRTIRARVHLEEV